MKKTIVVMAGLALVGCQSAAQKDPVVNVAPEVVAPVELAPEPVKPVPVEMVASKVETGAPVATAAPAATVMAEAEAAKAAQPVASQIPSTAPPKVASDAALAMDPRMGQVVKLIYTSSGARQVMESENPKAHEYHNKAKALYEQATQASEKQEASRLLDEAVKSMYTAIRSASPEKVLASKKKADFEKLQRSVDTFIEQHERISEEKGSGGEGQALRAQVKTLGVEAEKLFAAGRTDDAQKLLRESFEMLRDSIESMREGETLVRSLNFANKKDEYDYELERYKSQRLLVDVLLESKRAASPYVAKQVDGFITVAEEGRTKAEVAAGKGDYEAAITMLEDARKQIVRALRSGGIYVPG